MTEATQIAGAVRQSGLSIYDDLSTRRDLYFPLEQLEIHLRESLSGLWIGGPIRSRAKLAKQLVCESLGYSAPRSFAKVQPRFPGQNLDVYVQQANNLQVWNVEIDPTRRYALIHPGPDDVVTDVRVVTGDVLASLDTTGTLTGKYQAKRKVGRTGSVLVSEADTLNMTALLGDAESMEFNANDSTADVPTVGRVLPIKIVYERLLPIIGLELDNPGQTQERLRGEALQELVADYLEVGTYANIGQWPDIRSQAIEVKLQTSPTIDLGLVLPSSTDSAEMLAPSLKHSDVRYAIVYGTPTLQNKIHLDNLVVCTGAKFFDEFQPFGGLIVNRKIQIHLPQGFFEAE